MRSKLIFALVAVVFAIAGCGSSHPVPPSFMGSIHPPGWGKPPPPTALEHSTFASAATATMYDSVTVSTVPANPFALAGYVGGRWQTFLPMRHTWPRAHTISIAISSSEHADCLDVEPGDATPGLVVGWVRVELRLGWPHPCVYSDWWEWTHEIRWRLSSAGLLAIVLKWDADYTHVAHIDPGFDATQWTSTCFGRNLDCSLVFRYFLRVAHPPLVNPRSKPKPNRRQLEARLRAVDRLLGAYDRRRNPHGHNCQHPPYRHAYPSARSNRSCAVWAREAAAIKRALR